MNLGWALCPKGASRPDIASATAPGIGVGRHDGGDAPLHLVAEPS